MKNKLIILLVLVFASSCILEEVEPEYDIVGATGTITDLTASNTSPAVGETVTFTMSFYSEHEPITEMRMIRVNGDTRTTVETKPMPNFNVEDSYVETFQYTIPEDAAGTTLNMRFEIVTTSEFITHRNISLNVGE